MSSMMKEEVDAKTRRGIRITAVIVGLIAVMFYAFYVYLHLTHR